MSEMNARLEWVGTDLLLNSKMRVANVWNGGRFWMNSIDGRLYAREEDAKSAIERHFGIGGEND